MLLFRQRWGNPTVPLDEIRARSSPFSSIPALDFCIAVRPSKSGVADPIIIAQHNKQRDNPRPPYVYPTYHPTHSFAPHLSATSVDARGGMAAGRTRDRSVDGRAPTRCGGHTYEGRPHGWKNTQTNTRRPTIVASPLL